MPEVISISSFSRATFTARSAPRCRSTRRRGRGLAGGWVSVGYTLEPVKAQYTFDVLEVMVQQEMGTVKRIRIKEALKLGTILAELTATNMALAFAGEVIRELVLKSHAVSSRSSSLSCGSLRFCVPHER